MRKVDTDNLEQLSFDKLLEVYNEWKQDGGSMEYNWTYGRNNELYPELKELLKQITLESECLIKLENIDNVIEGFLSDNNPDRNYISRLIISLIRLQFKSVVFNYNFLRS